MIERTNDYSFEVVCDRCDAAHEEDTDGDFFRFIEYLKECGWKIRKVKDEWLHFCPECALDLYPLPHLP